YTESADPPAAVHACTVGHDHSRPGQISVHDCRRTELDRGARAQIPAHASLDDDLAGLEVRFDDAAGADPHGGTRHHGPGHAAVDARGLRQHEQAFERHVRTQRDVEIVSHPAAELP